MNNLASLDVTPYSYPADYCAGSTVTTSFSRYPTHFQSDNLSYPSPVHETSPDLSWDYIFGGNTVDSTINPMLLPGYESSVTATSGNTVTPIVVNGGTQSSPLSAVSSPVFVPSSPSVHRRLTRKELAKVCLISSFGHV